MFSFSLITGKKARFRKAQAEQNCCTFAASSSSCLNDTPSPAFHLCEHVLVNHSHGLFVNVLKQELWWDTSISRSVNKAGTQIWCLDLARIC